jgi:AcrR family transcriptional regulator
MQSWRPPYLDTDNIDLDQEVDSVKINFDSDKIYRLRYLWSMNIQDSKSYHHGNLRDALVTAGLQILEYEGPTALSLRAVARKAGVSHAAPAHHFPTLAHLLAEIAAKGFTLFVYVLDEAANQGEQNPAARLKAMGKAYVGFAIARKHLYALMFQSTGTVAWTETLDAAANSAWNQLAECTAALLKRAPSDPLTRAGAVRVWSLVHGFAMLTIDNRFPPDARGEAVHAAIDQAVAALPRLAKET